MEKGGSVPAGESGEEEMNVVDVGHPTIRRDSSPEQVNARKVRPIRGTLRNYNPIEASRPKNTPPNLRMQTLRGERPSTPDPDSQATLRKFNDENVKRCVPFLVSAGVVPSLRSYTHTHTHTHTHAGCW
jgi:hypothetical protein